MTAPIEEHLEIRIPCEHGEITQHPRFENQTYAGECPGSRQLRGKRVWHHGEDCELGWVEGVVVGSDVCDVNSDCGITGGWFFLIPLSETP